MSKGRVYRPRRDKVEAVRDALVSWFEENGRDLPWRRTRDPYRILVSEVMLQQIQVARAIPFYERFLERFPTVEALANAPISDAIRVWGDLGRYRRVVNLHRTARIVMDEHGGKVPYEPAILAKLPGIGPYTAGAVACFAFEKRAPFIDTNIRRVLHRVFVGSDVPEPAAKEPALLALAEKLVPPEGNPAWAWNQAVMELGALTCTARKPRCEACPLSGRCRARTRIAGALAAAPRAPRGTPAYRYEDSNRFWRGRVLARLRDAPAAGVSLRELGAALREGFGEGDVPWILNVVQSLEKDGLAVCEHRSHDNRAHAVAETHPAYGTEREVKCEEPVRLPDGETRVRLP